MTEGILCRVIKLKNLIVTKGREGVWKHALSGQVQILAH